FILEAGSTAAIATKGFITVARPARPSLPLFTIRRRASSARGSVRGRPSGHLSLFLWSMPEGQGRSRMDLHRRLNAFAPPGIQDQPAAYRKHCQAETRRQIAPDTLGGEQHDRDGKQPEQEQIPGAKMRKVGL